jgi:hypothetical protein
MIKIIDLEKRDNNCYFLMYEKKKEIFTFNGTAKECLDEMIGGVKKPVIEVQTLFGGSNNDDIR